MRRSFLVLALCCSALACSKDKDKPRDTREELGEPIGAQVPASGKLPSLTIALAVSKGQDPVPMLAPFVDAVTKAAIACPDFTADVVGKPQEPAGIEFVVEGGKLKLTGKSDPTPPAKCFAAALEGKTVGPATMPRTSGRSEIIHVVGDAGMP